MELDSTDYERDVLKEGLTKARSARRGMGLGPQAAVLAVAAYQALSHLPVKTEDVAGVLGCSVSTARRHLNDAVRADVLWRRTEGFGSMRYVVLPRTERERRAVEGERG